MTSNFSINPLNPKNNTQSIKADDIGSCAGRTAKQLKLSEDPIHQLEEKSLAKENIATGSDLSEHEAQVHYKLDQADSRVREIFNDSNPSLDTKEQPTTKNAELNRVNTLAKQGIPPKFTIKKEQFKNTDEEKFKKSQIELQNDSSSFSVAGYTQFPLVQKELHQFVLTSLKEGKIDISSAVSFFCKHKDESGLKLLKQEGYGLKDDIKVWETLVESAFCSNDVENVQLLSLLVPLDKFISGNLFSRLQSCGYTKMQEEVIARGYSPSAREERILESQKKFQETEQTQNTYKPPDRSLNQEHKAIYGDESAHEIFLAKTKESLQMTHWGINEMKHDSQIYDFSNMLTNLGSARNNTATICESDNYWEFGLAKDQSLYTPVSGIYASYGDRIKNDKKSKVSIEGRNYVLTRQIKRGNNTYIEHAYSSFWKKGDPVFLHTEALFQKIISSEYATPEDLHKDMAYMHWLLANVVPFVRGTASIAEVITDALWQEHGFIPERIAQGKSLDLEAQVSTFDAFREQYPKPKKIIG